MKQSVLVLEGGAMRSIYTSGVLDVLMQEKIDFDCVVGVSAGALVGSNYLSKQQGRTAEINIRYCKDSKYIGMGALKQSKGLVGFDYLFGEISKQQVPFDEETFWASNKRFVVGATNCLTGKTEYFEKGSADLYQLLQASSSMPLVSKTVMINHTPYLDGAIDCNIPIHWALEQGYEKIVIVLTRNKGYKKQPVSSKMEKIYRFAYKQYPNLLNSIKQRPEKYNQTYEEIERLQKEEKAFVFQPQTKVVISRLERNQDKLKELYRQGKEEAKRQLEELKKYL